MKNDYELMCKYSPVQNTWIPKRFDKTNKGYIEYFDKSHNTNCCGKIPDMIRLYEDHTHFEREKSSVIWILTQEEWQEIYFNPKNHTKTSKDPIQGLVETGGKIPIGYNWLGISSSDWNILWCLLVHKEVEMNWPWGKSTAVWDWEKKVWKKNTACALCDNAGHCMKIQCDEYDDEKKKNKKRKEKK